MQKIAVAELNIKQIKNIMTNISELKFIKDGENYARLCLDLTVYWRGSMFDRVEGVLHFYEQAMKELRPTLRFYETGTMSGAKPLRKDSLAMIPTWLRGKRRRDIYMMNLESGSQPNEPSDRNFYFVADEEDEEPLGALRLALPISHFKDPDRYIEFVRQLMAHLDFESGHAGYALNWDSRGDMAAEAMLDMSWIAGRYFGVDLFEMDVTLVSMRKTKPAGIKTVNWLTLVGKNILTSLGGEEGLSRKLPNICRVESLPHGVIIKAGDYPILGDRNRKEDLTAYRAVGHLLAPFRFEDHRDFFGSSKNAGITTQQWLARFDE